MRKELFIFISDCGKYAVIENDFVALYYDIKRLNLVAAEMGLDSFDLLGREDRYDLIYEAKEFSNVKPSKIEIL